MSALALKPVLSRMDLFLQSHLTCHPLPRGGIVHVIMMCGYISNYTRCIVQKREMGDDDYISHCQELFF